MGSTPQLLGVSSEKFEKLKEQAKTCSHSFISFALNCLTAALDGITKGQNAKIALDMAVYTMCNTQQVPQMMPARPQQRQTQPRADSQPAPEPIIQQAPPRHYEQTPKPEAKTQNAAERKEKQLPKIEPKPVQKQSDKPEEFAYWQRVIDLLADVDIPLYSLLKNSTAYLYDNIIYIKGSDGFNEYIRTNKEVNGIIKKAIFESCGRPYNIGGYRNIAHMFITEQHNSLNDILALQNLGVQVNIKD